MRSSSVAWWPPGQTSPPALVKDDHARERRQPAQKPGDGPVLPVELDVRNERAEQHKVYRPVMDHLVGDVDVTALRIAGLGHVTHSGQPLLKESFSARLQLRSTRPGGSPVRFTSSMAHDRRAGSSGMLGPRDAAIRPQRRWSSLVFLAGLVAVTLALSVSLHHAYLEYYSSDGDEGVYVLQAKMLRQG